MALDIWVKNWTEQQREEISNSELLAITKHFTISAGCKKSKAFSYIIFYCAKYNLGRYYKISVKMH